jgi:hypothetical protein
MRTIQIFRLAATVAVAHAQGRHGTAKRALWALLGAIKRAEALDAERAYVAAVEAVPALDGEELKAWRLEQAGRLQRGAVSLPLLTMQAAIAVGLASGVASIVAWAQGVLGGVL